MNNTNLTVAFWGLLILANIKFEADNHLFGGIYLGLAMVTLMLIVGQ